MPFISSEQVKKIIDESPEGVTPHGILAGLKQRGYEIGGLTAPDAEKNVLGFEKIKEDDYRVKPFKETPFGKATQAVGKFALKYAPHREAIKQGVFDFLKFHPDIKRLQEKDPAAAAKIFEQAKEKGIEQKTQRQMAGSAIETGVTIAMAGLGGLKTAGTFLQRVGPKVTYNFITGAGFGTGHALQDNKSTPQALINGFWTGALM